MVNGDGKKYVRREVFNPYRLWESWRRKTDARRVGEFGLEPYPWPTIHAVAGEA